MPTLALPPYVTQQVWQQAYSSLQWLSGQVATPGASGNPASLATQAVLVLDGLQAGGEILDIQNTLLSSGNLLFGIETAGALSISYTPDQTAAIAEVIVGFSLLPGLLIPLVPASFPGAASALAVGNPAMALTTGDSLLASLMPFTPASVPAGYDGSWASLQTNAMQAANTFATIVSAVASYYGASPQSPLDACIRVTQGMVMQASILSGMPTGDPAGAYLDPGVSWNQSFMVPALLTACRLVTPDPSTTPGQASMITRAFLAAMSQQTAMFAVVAAGLAVQATGATTTTQQNQGLMDVAAQNLGSFSAWQSITGSIGPPWGATAIPAGTTVSLQPGGGSIPTYAGLLGTDVALGEQNQTMPNWTGDYALTVGIPNYQAALGRRLATTLGSLLFHPDYGCRIPPEIGEVMTTGANALIAAYGQAAIAADPRTQSVLSAQAGSISGTLNSVAFQATVQPIGPGLPAVSVNEVITAPTGTTLG